MMDDRARLDTPLLPELEALRARVAALEQAEVTGRQAETALRASEERLRLLSEQVPAIVWTTDRQFRFTWGTGAGLARLGLAPDHLLGVTLADYFQTDDPTYPPLAAHRRALAGEAVTCEMAWAGRTYQAHVEPFRDASGQIVGCIGVALDITERKALEIQLAQQARQDPLTGLPNRACFLERLEQALARAQRRETPVAVLFVDLDNFKAINDRLGHQGGDQVLVAVAERLQACVRGTDTAARLGGDEFTIVLDESADLRAAAQVAERILAAFQPAVLVDGRAVCLTASIGIAQSVTGQDRPDDLLRAADEAMFRAKSMGKARYEGHRVSVTHEAVEAHRSIPPRRS